MTWTLSYWDLHSVIIVNNGNNWNNSVIIVNNGNNRKFLQFNFVDFGQ